MTSIDGEAIESAAAISPRPPAGHYSPTFVVGDLVFISGQLPIDRDGVPLADRPFAEQVAQVLENVRICLSSRGLTPRHLAQVRVYVSDIERWPEFDGLYARWIGDHRPARAVVPVPVLHHGVALEIEAVASAVVDPVSRV
ncbi:MAG: RidA family protein [Nakamurella sp.]